MKKLFFSAIALILIAGSASAQYFHPRESRRNERTYNNNFRPTFTLIGGMNIANIIKSNDNNFHTDTKLGLSAGVGLDLPIAYPLSFTIEGLYSQKGYSATTSYGQFRQRTEFIDLPLLLKFHVVPGFNFLIGPQVSFLMSTKNIYDNGFTESYEQYYNNTSNGYNKTLVDGVAGVSIDLGQNLELRGRYALDLSRINDNGDAYVPQYRNQVWQVGLGIKF